MVTNPIARRALLAGVEEVRGSWGWFLVLGILFIILGVLCITGEVAATFATILVLGWFLMLSGVVALVHAFRVRSWSGFVFYLLGALLRGFTGYLLLRYPASGAVAVTLILASFFIVGGLFRAIGAAALRLPRWGWSAFSGFVSFVLGVMLLAQMPVSAVWFIGLAIGIDLIIDGIALVGLATVLHRVPKLSPVHP
jgi:uncharacterized membrane protein HdeD (DUF308 family)